MTAAVQPLLLRGDARALPLADESVDLIVTSPPYFGLRSYQDGGEHYAGQLGAEASPGVFIDALIGCTREMVRVLKPTGSIFLNLGDKYSGAQGQTQTGLKGRQHVSDSAATWRQTDPRRTGIPTKSLMMLPERYRVAAVDELGLIARAVLVWSKPNALPESVTDRARRSHEDWVHLTKQPRYFAAVDEIRDPPSAYTRPNGAGREPRGGQKPRKMLDTANPLGRTPGSVWEIPTQPLTAPAELGVDHYAAFPMEWPRRLITGWCPREVCTACGDGRRPVTEAARFMGKSWAATQQQKDGRSWHGGDPTKRSLGVPAGERKRKIVGYICDCPEATAPSAPGVVLDPFGGTGPTALVASMLGRRGISVDLSADYGRLAAWRCSDPKERARAAGTDPTKVAVVAPEQPDLFGGAA